MLSVSYIIFLLWEFLEEEISYENKNLSVCSKDVNTVKKLVDDCVSCQLSSSDAVSALGPMYDSHDKNYLPRMHAFEGEISNLLDFCRDKKNEMNMFVHSFMQKIAFIQHKIKEVRYKFSVFHEALKRQDDQFEQIKVVRGIFPSYRASLAEVVRRKAAMKIYMGKAGKLAEKLATERNLEIRRREEFLRANSNFIPRDILASMGLFDTPNPCDVYVAPFDSNLLNIDLVHLERYAPESLLGVSSKSEKNRSLRNSLSISDDGYLENDDLLEESELVEIEGTSKMEVENTKLKAELASKVALICSMRAELDHESFDEGKLDSVLKNTVEKTSEALNLKDEYEKYLQSMLKAKQKQCESYEKRIQELEQKLSGGEDESKLMISASKTDDNKSEVLCGSNTSKSGILTEHDNMTDSSSMVNSQLDSSMLDLHREKGNICDKDKTTMPQPDVGTSITSSNMAVSIIPDSDVKGGTVVELQNALAEKSSQLENAEAKIRALMVEVSGLERDLAVSQKLLDESQVLLT